MSIYELVKNEARLFKYGSGTGTNFSAIRGQQEKLSGGGTSSGLMSFLEVFDRAAGATKSRRHHAPRGEDGLPRHGPPGDRRLHQLEGARGEEGAGAHRRGLLERLQRRGLPHGHRPELEQLGPRDRRLHEAPSLAGGKWQTIVRTTGEVVRHATTRKDLWRPGRRGGVGLRRSGRAVRHDDQQVAHLPEHGTHQRVEPVLRVHVPRRHGLQPVVASTSRSSSRERRRRSTSRATATPCRVFFIAQEILVDFSCYPTERHRAEQPRLPPARPRLREPRHAADADGRAVRLATRAARSPAALTAIMCGKAYAVSRRDGRVARARSPASRRTASRCSA